MQCRAPCWTRLCAISACFVVVGFISACLVLVFSVRVVEISAGFIGRLTWFFVSRFAAPCPQHAPIPSHLAYIAAVAHTKT